LRLFVTCQSSEGTVVKLVDRQDSKNATGEDVYEFKTVQFKLKIEQDSQPFVADLNGDYLEDILYTDPSSNKIMVALQNPFQAYQFVLT
jgi:hypothetical protein